MSRLHLRELAELLRLPAESELAAQIEPLDPQRVTQARDLGITAGTAEIGERLAAKVIQHLQ